MKHPGTSVKSLFHNFYDSVTLENTVNILSAIIRYTGKNPISEYSACQLQKSKMLVKIAKTQ